VAIGEETVGIYSFSGKVGGSVSWQVEMSLHGTPFSVVAATISAAMVAGGAL
jgi:hypothetical protein